MPRKLSPEQEDAIIERYKRWRPGVDVESLADLADELGTTKTTIMTVLRRRGVPFHRNNNSGGVVLQATDVNAFGAELIRQLEDKRRLEARIATLERLLKAHKIPVPSD